jgi:hypothetical protein
MNRVELVTRNALHKIENEAQAFGKSDLARRAGIALCNETNELSITVRSIVEAILDNSGDDGK